MLYVAPPRDMRGRLLWTHLTSFRPLEPALLWRALSVMLQHYADALQRREVNSYITAENGRRYDAVTVICFPLDNFWALVQ